MSDDKKQPPTKEADRPPFVPHQTIFEQSTVQKGANVTPLKIGDVPDDVQQVMKIAKDLTRFFKP